MPANNSVDRRSFLKLLALCCCCSLPGCARLFPNPDPGKCPAPSSGSLIIDAHCHLMNLRDLNRLSFIERRYLGLDEEPEMLGFFATLGAWFASLPGYWFTKSAWAEYVWLKKNTPQLQTDPQIFCELAARDQPGMKFPEKDKQPTGFFSNRTRLAARMMEIYDQVDIFMPAMVDFYEGDWTRYSYPTELVYYYKQLHIASKGRFLPLVSFSPERYFYEEVKKGGWEISDSYKRNFELVRYAIEEQGFVGVKLHPSSGFSPILNSEYGCSNTPLQSRKKLPEEMAQVYDEILMELFTYCRSVDVPLMVHSGTGISAYRNCMEDEERPKEEWTNSPYLWGLALNEVNKENTEYNGRPIPDEQKLRVCLAHFAGAFCREEKLVKSGTACSEHGVGAPHPWLEQAANLIRNHPEVYVDLADVAEWFGSESENYKIRFNDFIGENDDLALNMLYGTDWHMPGVSAIGSSYLTSAEGFLPTPLKDRTMGLNAMHFYGLAKDRPTRKRLESFYERNGIRLEEVGWIAKVDSVT